MNRNELGKLLVSLAICLLLAACKGVEVRNDDATGELGTNEKDSPGDLYVNLAAEYLRQGQMETALTKAQKALSEDPRNARAHSVIALIYQRLGQDQLAETHFQKAIALRPKDPYVLNSYASFLCDRKKFSEAETQYTKALANPLYRTPWIAMTNLGTCAQRSGNVSKAEGYYSQALRAKSTFSPALAGLAELEYSRGKPKSAKSYLDSYFRLAQPTPQVLLLAVRVERKLGSTKRAKTYAQLLRKSYPGSPEALQL